MVCSLLFSSRMRVQQSNSERGVCCWCGGWDLNPRTPTGQGPEPCAFDLTWQPPLGGAECETSQIKPCASDEFTGPGFSRVVQGAISLALQSLGPEGPSGDRPVLPGIPLYFSISRSLFSQSRICLSFSSWLRICEVLL